MAQYGWSNAPSNVRAQIDGLVAALREILAGNLAGIYLHGSLAMGCFNPERSDIDLLVITHNGMSRDQKRRCAQALLRLSDDPRPIEISFMRIDALHDPIYPPVFELHYGEDWRQAYLDQLAGDGWRLWNDGEARDPDLPGHLMITTTRGITLAGQPIPEVFPPVAPAHYLASILGDVAFARELIGENPVYAVLNLCRIYWYLLEGTICSKDEAGAWAVQQLPAPYRPIVAQALDHYRGEAGAPFEQHRLVQFTDFICGAIERLASTRDVAQAASDR